MWNQNFRRLIRNLRKGNHLNLLIRRITMFEWPSYIERRGNGDCDE